MVWALLNEIDMENPEISTDQVLAEMEALKAELREAHATLEAIRTGQVDALIVQGDNGHQIYTLKGADETYRVFIEKMREGAVTLNRNGVILYSNSRFAETMNIPLERLMGLPFTTFVQAESKESFSELIKSGFVEDFKCELSLVTNDQKVIPFLISFATLELDGGTSLSIILTDLSDLKETERQLKLKNEQLLEARNMAVEVNNALEDTIAERTKDLSLSREYFKMLADSMLQMAWTNLPSGEISFFNQRWYEYTGLSYDKLKDWRWRSVVHPDDLPNTMRNYLSALQHGHIFSVENRYKREDGTYRWHLNRSSPVRDENGTVIFWIGTATDIEDQRKEMERKDEFIGIASHELKTPLTSLKGYLQLMEYYKKEELPTLIKQFIGKANLATNKLSNLVNDLLDVSKIQAGKLEFHQERVSVKHLIQDAVENAKMIYPLFDIVDQTTQDFTVLGSFVRLEQVLMNFISNSVKYFRSEKRILLNAEQTGAGVKISVIDFGIGLSESQRARIFERFYRVEDKNYQASGLGMGLYISSEIIKAHDGKIGVDSAPGQGSTFYFILPLL